MSILSANIGFSACKKQDSTIPAIILKINKTTGILLGEPVSFNVTSVTSATTAIWSISPASNSKISGSGLSASILFREKGKYSVTA